MEASNSSGLNETMMDSPNLMFSDSVEFLSVFQSPESLSQGDNYSQYTESCSTSTNPSGDTEKNCPSTFNLEDFNFLETVILNEDLNMDGPAEIAGDPLQLSSFDEINCDFSNILTSEQSFDLNSISDLVDIGSSCDITVPESLDKEIEIPPSKTITESSDGAEDSSELAGKYKEMRRKNNLASRRSRKIRKIKDSEMSDKLKKLEKENKDLLLLSEKLEKERDLLKEYLFTVMSKKN